MRGALSRSLRCPAAVLDESFGCCAEVEAGSQNIDVGCVVRMKNKEIPPPISSTAQWADSGTERESTGVIVGAHRHPDIAGAILKC